MVVEDMDMEIPLKKRQQIQGEHKQQLQQQQQLQRLPKGKEILRKIFVVNPFFTNVGSRMVTLVLWIILPWLQQQPVG